MANGFEFRVDGRALRGLERRLRLAAKSQDKAAQRAMASTRRATFTESKRAVQSEYNLKQQRIAQGTTVLASTKRRAFGFVIKGKKETITWGSYGARATSNGTVVRILKKLGAIRFGSVFGARGLGGNPLHFERIGVRRRMKAGNYEGQRREVIAAKKGPSIADAHANKVVFSRIEQFFFDRLDRELLRQLKTTLDKGISVKAR